MNTEDTDHTPITADLEPVGKFRWLHDRRSMRCPRNPEFIASELPQDWSPQAVILLGRHELDALAPSNAWSIGIFGNTDLLEDYWSRLTPLQRGQAIAGISEHRDKGEWIDAHISTCRFDATSATQTACNALLDGSDATVREVIFRCDDLEGQVTRFCMSTARYYERFKPIIDQLAKRAIDFMLEAALLVKNGEAVRLLLQHDADPNIPIWCLEKSFNERHCALSHAIDFEADDIVFQLLDAGANPQGIAFCTLNRPLYEAVAKGNRKVAVALLERGASFASSDPGLERATTIASVRKANPRLIQPHSDYFFGFFPDEVNRVQKSAGKLIELIPIWEKQCFYEGSGQGGEWQTFLHALKDDVDSIKFFEPYGLDTRLAAEELLELVKYEHDDALAYLLPKQKALVPLTKEELHAAVVAAVTEKHSQR